MRLPRYALVMLLFCSVAGSSASAAGLMIPEDKKLPPLAMVNLRVDAAIEDQVAITTVEQTFRNHTDRPLEATYIFPVPRGASVDKFTMWIDGKETGGELLDAKKASQVYTDIVRRTQDPGLLEYLGNDMMRMRVFPIPAHGDQKIKLSYKSIAPLESGIVEYIYPLKTDGKSTRTLEDFSVKLSLKSSHAIANIYSPTHAITISRKGDREAAIVFERNQGVLDKDFQLFYGYGDKDIGLTPIVYKPVTAEDGYFMILVSPQSEVAKVRVPRDMVMVLDTSSSMSDLKMQQAKKALKYCLAQLGTDDRFGILKFSTSVVKFRDELVPASKDYLERANKWVDDLRTSGGTAIWPALDDALGMRPAKGDRPFNMVFFTDGQPTVDETNPDKILKNVIGKNSGNTRIFTFGVGDDVNANMLDQLADATRAVSTFVRPAEDIEVKVSGLYAKISNPVLTDVRLTAGDNVRLHEIYPPRLPDLFYGTQLVVIGRYAGGGHSAVRLTGQINGEKREFIYDVHFPEKTEASGKDFVEPLWARRKVGYLLDQIRANGEQKELVEEVTTLAKRYGIATPYTSYLVVPDGPMPVVVPIERRRPFGPFPLPMGGMGGGGFVPPGLTPGGPTTAAPAKVSDFAKAQAPTAAGRPDTYATNRGAFEEKQAAEMIDKFKDSKEAAGVVAELRKYQLQKKVFDDSEREIRAKNAFAYQSGALGVDLALASNGLRNQDRLTLTANRQVAGRNCLELGGVWIDDTFKADMKTVIVKSQGEAYFSLLAKHPELKDVFRLGNHLVWVSPSGTALVIDQNDGSDKLTDGEMDALFAKK